MMRLAGEALRPSGNRFLLETTDGEGRRAFREIGARDMLRRGDALLVQPGVDAQAGGLRLSGHVATPLTRAAAGRGATLRGLVSDPNWQLLNAPALRGVLDFATCAADPNRLLRLAPNALAMNRVLTLLHTCIHRAVHLTSPYFVDGITYFGGDRLIWAKDIDLLAGALSAVEWEQFSVAALDQRVAAVALDGLLMAQRCLGTRTPQAIADALDKAGAEPASSYLLGARQMGRAWQDLLAIPGWNRRMAYLATRFFPSASFMRAKYPMSGHLPVALLHVRRMGDLVRPRPDRTSGQ